MPFLKESTGRVPIILPILMNIETKDKNNKELTKETKNKVSKEEVQVK